ncbi:ubiquitin carboxyl-terminal hydrolase MINDY-1/2 [Entomortierella parvispora]|uniref:Ubiquitin carboxyl-terminal hydrolase MINDY-1/2 n=1 Tax=Entomortierella parvispora TaxID=205924 RepID=A0A9P3LZZ2_9FUNG|nr:ubiquitin carboxyl-terminal hydrolase MINDY-1/2 [Entomortierella parvispora]
MTHHNLPPIDNLSLESSNDAAGSTQGSVEGTRPEIRAAAEASSSRVDPPGENTDNILIRSDGRKQQDLDPFDGEDPFSVSISSANSPALAAGTLSNGAFSIPIGTTTLSATPSALSLAAGGRDNVASLSPSLSTSTTTPSGTTPLEPVTAISSGPRSATPAPSAVVAAVPESDVRNLLQEGIPEGLPPAYSQLEPLPGTTFPVVPAATIVTDQVPPSLPERAEPPAVPPRQQEQQQPSPQPQPQQQQAQPEPESMNEYVLKPIDWIDPATGVEKRIKIITQNENGPCPLLALCNTLILQGKVSIRPYDRPNIGYEHLLQLLADYLLNDDPSEVDSPAGASTSSASAPRRVGDKVEAEKQKSRLEIESALRLLPHLEHGLDVNVYFKSIRGFESTAELGLFHTFGVELVHGWVVSPVLDTDMYELVDGSGPDAITSYNKAVECIVSGDDAGGGLIVEDLKGNLNPITRTMTATSMTSSASAPAGGAALGRSNSDLATVHQSKEERIRRALIVQEFMNTTRTQLTHYGLHVLQESLPEGHLCAFFRNNHFCTLFKNPMDGILYTLVTDQSLAHEQSIVWESLADVDGAGDFLDGLFRHGALEVGDYARNNQPLGSTQHPGGAAGGEGDGGGDQDFALALQLQQQEEEEEARRVQKANSRLSTNKGAPNSLSPAMYGSGIGGSVGGSSGDNGILHPTQVYESDEQMAARLHQEYLASSQQELRRNQSQAYPPPQQLQQNNFNHYSGYMPQPAPQIYEAYPPPGAAPPATQRPYTGPAQTAFRPPPSQPQQFHPVTLTTSASQRRPQTGSNHNGRNRNSSEGSDRSSKDKCTIM